MSAFPADPWAGFRKPGFPAPPGDPQVRSTLGPRIISDTPAAAPGAMPSMTLDALMARQKELAGQRNPLGDMTSPMQGIAYALKEGLHGFQEGRNEREQSEGRDLLAQTMAQVDPIKGPTPEQAQIIWQLDPDLGTAIYGKQAETQEQWTVIPTPPGESGQWLQNEKGDRKKVGGGEGAGGPKESDVNSMADDFVNVPDVKKFQNAQSMWASLQDASTRDTPQADLNMVIGLAKMFDPDSVVRTEEGKAVELTGNLPSNLLGQFKYLIGDPTARLDRNVRIGMLEEGFSRMSGYYKGVQEASNWFTEKAKRRGYDPRDVVRPFAAPTPFDPKKVVGSGNTGTGKPSEPQPPLKPGDPAPDPSKEVRSQTTAPDGTVTIIYMDGTKTVIPPPKKGGG